MASANAIHRRTKSLWNWVPVRAFAKIRYQKFYCVFSIFVQTIDGLPSFMDGLRLVVKLEHKSKCWQTMPSRVFHHMVEFDETLHIETTIFGRKANMEDCYMKFLPKDYILSVVAIDAKEHFLFNQHRIDLSRLLPVFIEGFWEPEKPMSSTASFKLGGKAEGAVLVATFDFEVLNEELRRPIFFFDGNASARFGGSSLQRVSRAVKSLPNSPNPSPFVRRANHHFTSPCSSDAESTDSTYMGKFDLDSSTKETEEWSVYDYSSSDEERFQALKNDPLSLDAFTEAESVSTSPAIRVKKALGFLGDLRSQIHLTNGECVEKIEVPLVRRLGINASGHQIDVQTPSCHHDTRDCSKMSPASKEMAKSEVLEKNSHDGEVAADKFCINIEFVNSSSTTDISNLGAYDVVRAVSLEGKGSIGDFLLPPGCVECKRVDSDGGVSSPEQVELFSTVTEKHLLVEGGQPFSIEGKVECTPMYCKDKDGIRIDVQAHLNCGVPVVHSWEDEGLENGLENLSNCFVEQLDLSASSPRSESEGCMDVQTLSDGKAPVAHSGENMGHEDGAQNSVDVSVDICDLSASLPRHEMEVCMNVQAHFYGGVPVAQSWDDVGLETGLDYSSDVDIEGLHLSASSSTRIDIGASMDIQALPNGEVPAVHPWQDVGQASGLENLSGLSVEALDSSALSSMNEISGIFQFNDENEISLEASVVVEDFFDFLEREEESTCLGQNCPSVGFLEVIDKQMLFSKECKTSSVEQEESFVFESLKPVEPCMTIGSLHARQLTCGAPENDVSDKVREDDLGLFSIIEAAELEMRKAAQSLQSKERAKMLEDAETKALMKEWGLSDKVFERHSQKLLLPGSASDMSIFLNSASVIMLKDGGCLKAVDAQSSCGNLMMQFSKPVVIPASSSLCALDILSSMAFRGLNDMTVEAFMKMPLEDLESSSVDHILRSAKPTNCSPYSWQRPFEGLNVKESSAVPGSSSSNCLGYKSFKVEAFSERLVAFEDLTNVALHVIEPLSIEGLKLQYNISKEAPGSISLKSLNMQIAMNDKVGIEGLQEASLVNVGRQVKIPERVSPLDIALSLDEWLCLFEHVKMPEGELSVARDTFWKEDSSKADKTPGWATWAHHSNSFTVVMRLQLRDPWRYYEPVGASMLALVQVEKASVRSELSSIDGVLDSSLGTRSGIQLRLTAVHIAGVKQPSECRSQLWGTEKQLHSGSRWLMANFKASNLRHVMSQASTPSEDEASHVERELMWSISSRMHTPGRTCREPEDTFNPCIRNPDILFAPPSAGKALHLSTSVMN
ncbi:hypothetical protein GOP47_0022213 [Adiantum capillus-veneris]|uniref:C2 NT-type domain-containing protein n=1 Tax=Adiantum capillus-veneris TaxID=13818 RepID=A0A9D4U8X1_ADICA|nr:hypothetical protein GOP47_0022213 [Adiantum capillus-veneris]